MQRDYYLACIELIRRELPEVQVQFELQTNATLLNSAWAEFILKEKFAVGVSIDGPRDFHDAQRRYRSGQGTHSKTMRGMTILEEANVPYSIICVLNREGIKSPQAYADFFETLGRRSITLNIPTSEGVSGSYFLADEDTQNDLRQFMHYFAVRYLASKDEFRITQIESMVRRLLSTKSIEYDEHKACRILSLNSDGNLFTFSPELAGFGGGHGSEFLLGNVLRPSTIDFSGVTRTAYNILTGKKRCKESCKYYDVCGGGLPSPKYFELGDLSATRHPSCVLSTQVLADATASAIMKNKAP
jgi:uncharacterized protein